ncbi:uncharacterized protein DUF4194 [Ruminiclostridium sufflavum DSM 19573]|uniref:Uncharacterized protein DUF4194 n=1 Tax=Ruminiclostridium sufflavum DSM 19573 TaxID=1121337 RepID=A0A318XRR1_9FIRM|nr:DUF4194 domain-containing protein [Ruminiclostridium sufflavum]PYG90184.1 uncharacterized protein DUF4194 [Ruminiclostridium sufflavum DSM 19573]
MFPYYRELLDEDRNELTEAVKALQSQTYILERKYDKRTERYIPNKLYRTCERHLDFLKEYFKIADTEIIENRQFSIMFIRTHSLQGDKLSRLTTIFILLLKLIFDEQMAAVSNSIYVYTTLNEVYGKIQLFRLWNGRSISPTEVRKTIAALKRYQVIEMLEDIGEPDGDTRFIIYPTVNLLFDGQSMESIIQEYQEDEEDSDNEPVSSTDEDVSEQLALH